MSSRRPAGERVLGVIGRFLHDETVGALVLLVVLAFGAGQGSAAHYTPAFPAAINLSAMATALVPVMWAYDGWADLSYMSGEVKDPSRILPRALITGTILIIAIYLSVNLAYLYLVPVEEIAGKPLIAATGAPDSAFAALKAHFSDTEIADLTFAISIMNAFNRLAVSMRQ